MPLGLSEKGSIGLDKVVFVPFKGRGKPRWKKAANPAHARLHTPGDRAITQLKN